MLQETLSQLSIDAINANMNAVYPQGLKGSVSEAPIYFLDNPSVSLSTSRSALWASLIGF